MFLNLKVASCLEFSFRRGENTLSRRYAADERHSSRCREVSNSSRRARRRYSVPPRDAFVATAAAAVATTFKVGRHGGIPAPR